MKYLSFITLLWFCSCATTGLPGYISESKTEFDGSQSLHMEPAYLCGSHIKLGLYKTSKMTKNEYILTAVVLGSHRFAPVNSLQFNVNDKIIRFQSINEITDINTGPGFYGEYSAIQEFKWSSKDYIITEDFLNKILSAKKVWVKIELERSYMEGEFSVDTNTTAKPAFRDFKKKSNVKFK